MDKLLEYFEKYFYSRFGLFLGYAIVILVIAPTTYQLAKDMSSTAVAITCYLLLLVVYTIFWLYKVHTLPRSRKEIGVILSYEYENEKQRNRIEKDFALEIKRLIEEKQLSGIIEVNVLKKHQAEKVNRILQKGKSDIKKGKPNRQIKKLFKTTNASIFIYGTIKERNDSTNCYIIESNVTVQHNEIPDDTKEEFHKDLNLIPVIIKIPEMYEYMYFELSKKMMYIYVRYITGIVFFISQNVKNAEIAIALHDGLLEEVQKLKIKESNRNRIYQRIKDVYISENLQVAIEKYVREENYAKAKEIIEKIMRYDDVNYHCLISYAYVLFMMNKDVSNALASLDKADAASNGDYSWLLSKSFLLAYIGDYTRLMPTLERLRVGRDQIKHNIIDECIHFDKIIYEQEPKKIQICFLVAYLYFIKREFDMAVRYFSQFRRHAEGTRGYSVLLTKTAKCMKILE